MDTELLKVLNYKKIKEITNEWPLTTEDIEQLKETWEYCNKNNIKRQKLFDKLKYLLKYDRCDILKRFKILTEEKLSNCAKKSFITRYGVIEGTKRYENYANLQAKTNTFEYKKERYGWTQDDFNKFNRSRAVTLENLIKKHGEEKGKIKWEKYCEAQRHTNTLEYYIEKYGDTGIDKWKKYNYDKGKSGRLTYYTDELGWDKETALDYLNKKYNNNMFTSNAELIFIDCLEEKINKKLSYTAKYGKQFSIWCHKSSSIRFYDIAFPEHKKIIEFYGDYWHCNPKTYDSDFVLSQSNKTAREVWEDDRLKNLTALENGFTVMIVWESDFKNNMEEILNKCQQWLNLK